MLIFSTVLLVPVETVTSPSASLFLSVARQPTLAAGLSPQNPS